MFYNNGIIFQSTFEQNINIPKLGESLAEALNHMKQAYKICNYPSEDYVKLIFETEDISAVIIKLGEDSNLALFFKKEELKDLNLTPIRRYITRIEELIDMDKKELILEEESRKLQNDLQSNLDKINKLQEKVKEGEITPSEEEKQISKEIVGLYEESIKKREMIDHINDEISELKEKIESDKKKE